MRALRPVSVGITAAVGLCTAAWPALAHHSYADFEPCKIVSIEGEIAKIEWVNPHILITLETDDAGTYTAVWFSLTQLAVAGVAAETLHPNERVVVTGSPHRDDSELVLTRLTEIRRASDGWTWSRQRRGASPSPCEA
jgi:hypothetical protein